VRGYVTGFVEAFDHHFNIGLRDVYEVYKRRKYAFSENKVGHLGEPKDCSALLKRMGIDLPKVEKAQSLNRKYVEISRKCENMLIRGEQVVLVTKDQELKIL
jgi:small nuclear ribonucleoprotein (snRNP)-like protein